MKRIKMNIGKRIMFLLPLLAVLALTTSLIAQIDGVDNKYAPRVTTSTGVFVSAESVQPDGKIIVAGSFTVVNDVIRSEIVRLNTDGSVDSSFTCTACTFGVVNTLVQPDGKILVAGQDTSVGFFKAKLIRLNSDGSQDMTFANPFAGLSDSFDRFATLHAIQADGKIYTSVFTSGVQTANRVLYRVNPNGTLDSGFTTLFVNERPSSGQSLWGVTIMPDGRVFVFGNTPYGYLARLNPDGTQDLSFESPTLSWPPGPFPGQPIRPYINSFGEQSDGKFVLGGRFDSVNAIPKIYAARLNTNGSVDETYAPQPTFGSSDNYIVKVFPGDKTLYVRKDTSPKKVVLINSDGTVDPSYSAPDLLTHVRRTLLLAGDKLLVYGTYNGVTKYIRLNSDGSLDSGFTSPTFEREGSVTEIAVGADGKAVIYGSFTKVNGTPRPGIARLNTDGTLDTAFNPGGTGFIGPVLSIAIQGDGKVIFGGSFNGYNEGPQPGLVRLNADGSFDSAFDPAILPAGSIRAVALRADGKILIGGTFNFIDSTPKAKIALLNSDGTLDSAFATTIGGTDPYVGSFVVQSDGKIMIGGFFSGVSGFNRNHIARLNSDGTLDAGFNASTSFISHINQLSDGKYMVQEGNGGLKRLLSTGAADNTFTTPTVGFLDAVQPAAGGTVLIGGNFTTVNGTAKKYLARLLSDGSLDTLFNPNGANARVWALAAQADGNIIVGGDFYKIGSVGRINVARLILSAVANVTPFDFDGDGRADISVTRPGDFNWYQLTGVNYNFGALQFGQVGDKVTPADFDGDGKTDIGVFRPATGDWWYRGSIDGLQHGVHWGQNGDVPLAGDYNGDGKDDLVAVRNYGWWIANASNAQTIMFINFGQVGDKLLVGDFDGDGKADPAVYRPSEGNWYYAASGSGYATLAFHWGIAEDIPVPADYDGDGKTDAAVFRPSEGNWYVLSSLNGTWTGLHFGLTGDKSIAADYDGDGKADIAVYRPSDHYWYILGTTAGFYGFPFGLDTDIPSPNAFIP
jgi:uncharacterized delta-60 repeat protein